jgi:phenylalanyl-tRNA synthetase beta chain
MKIALSWLKDFIKHDFVVRELAERLTMAGLEVESVETIGDRFQGVVVGEVLSVEKVPKADKLSLCKVNVGWEMLSIVCGAPNVREGIAVPVAKIDAVLPGNLQIKKTTIRGIESEGMICSCKELGLSDDHSGIIILDKTRFKPGDAFTDQSDGTDAVFEINVTPNRPDCLSVRGIAREVSVLYGTALHISEAEERKPGNNKRQSVSIQILDEKACPRYSAQFITGVHIEPSPDWLRKRLELIGLNSINNIVDITNYVMMETGQPLHAFDFDLLEGGGIVVRKTVTSDVFVTLDGQGRNLTPDDLLICDANKPVAIAGVMGGQNSEVSEKTTRILLESAYFNPMTIRKTAARLGMSSEACQRFERGTDPNNTVGALKQAVQLIRFRLDGLRCGWNG